MRWLERVGISGRMRRMLTIDLDEHPELEPLRALLAQQAAVEIVHRGRVLGRLSEQPVDDMAAFRASLRLPIADNPIITDRREQPW
jgi:hypothetical protein